MPPEYTIWMYWTDTDPAAARPPYIEACFESIQDNSGCAIELCDGLSARRLLPDLPEHFERLKPAHQSDLFRVGVLAKYGGMYLDADTFVLKSLRPLFEILESYEFIGADWRPVNRNEQEFSPLGIGCLGPAKPGLRFLLTAYERQLAKVAARSEDLVGTRRYPFRWQELLRDIVVPCFEEHPPVSKIFDGAATWFTLVGGPSWEGGNLKSPLRAMGEIGWRLPDCELFTISNSLLPEEIREASVEALAGQDTILGYLLRSTSRRPTGI